MLPCRRSSRNATWYYIKCKCVAMIPQSSVQLHVFTSHSDCIFVLSSKMPTLWQNCLLPDKKVIWNAFLWPKSNNDIFFKCCQEDVIVAWEAIFFPIQLERTFKKSVISSIPYRGGRARWHSQVASPSSSCSSSTPSTPPPPHEGWAWDEPQGEHK